MSSRPRRLQPLDRLSLSLMVLLGVIIAVLVTFGQGAAARVREFSWADQNVSAADEAFLLTFSRPMERDSVEQNLIIAPPLPGKFSWAGRRMAYTLDQPAPYGENFEISLPQASDRFEPEAGNFEAFSSAFKTRDRAFAYIGVEGENQGRLVLYNFTQQTETPLTPTDWVVLDFEPYPDGSRILFSATDYQSYQTNTKNQSLYTVTTGLGLSKSKSNTKSWWQAWKTDPPKMAGQIEPILGSIDYQNLKFDLSPNGQTIVVQRISQTDPNDFGPWVLPEGAPPRRLETEPGGDFIIAPDSQSLLLQQGQGTAVIALTETADESAGETLDFLPEYGLVLDVADDGSAAAMVSFNQDDPEKRYTQSLFWVSNQGEEKPLLNATGAILDAQFDPTHQLIYCLISQLLPGETYQVQPYLIAVNTDTGELYDLLALPPQPSARMSLSPDGLAVLYDETVEVTTSANPIRTSDGRTIETGKLWLVPLFQTQQSRLNNQPNPAEPETLPFPGLSPTWMP
ncbi:MAG: hypothetical protein AAFU71_11185 [Cyanobacteria bacterium J06632_22]